MRKSQLKGFLLTLIFGPIGLFYSSVVLGLVFLVLTIIVGAMNLGAAILFWPLSTVVGIIAIKKRNSQGSVKLREVKTKEDLKKKLAQRKRNTTQDEMEELADFRIRPSSEPSGRQVKKAKKQAKWVNPGER